MLSASPHLFSTQSLHYQNWKSNKYSIITVIELGPPVSKSSTRISKFYAPTDSEQKFHKTGIENWLPIGFERKLAVATNTLCSTANGKGLKVLYTHSQLLEQPWRHFTSLKLCNCGSSQNPGVTKGNHQLDSPPFFIPTD